MGEKEKLIVHVLWKEAEMKQQRHKLMWVACMPPKYRVTSSLDFCQVSCLGLWPCAVSVLMSMALVTTKHLQIFGVWSSPYVHVGVRESCCCQGYGELEVL